jgi:hypothetical protein
VHVLAQPGHIPFINAPTLASAHGEFCTACRAGEPCYINSFSQILCAGYDVVWNEGGPTPALSRPDRVPVPSPESSAFAALSGKWLAKGAVVDTMRGEIINPCHGFVAYASTAPLTPAMAAVIAGGGAEGQAALLGEATTSASAIWGTYLALLKTGVSHSCAWARAAVAADGEAKARMICAPEDVNDHSAGLRFAHMPLGELLRGVRHGWVFAKLDLRNYFYNFRVSAAFAQRLGFPWLDLNGTVQWRRMDRLPMGAAGSPFWACLGSAEIHAIFRLRLARDGPAAGFSLDDMRSLVYCDDFCLAAASREALTFMMSTLRSLLAELDLEVSEDKTCQPGPDGLVGSTSIIFLGLELSSLPPAISIPPQGLVKTARSLLLVSYALGEEDCKVGIPGALIASAAGLVNRLLEASPSLGPSSRALVSTLQGSYGNWFWATSSDKAALLSADAHELLAAIHTGAWGATTLRAPRAEGDNRRLSVTSDFGCSGRDLQDRVAVVIGGVAAWVVHTPDTTGLTMPNLELLAVALFLVRYGPLLSGFWVDYGCDSACVVAWLNRRRASCPCANNLIALILRLAVRYEVDLAFHWVSRYANYAADRLCTGESPAALAALGATGIPRAVVHTTIQGLPCDFLRGASNSVAWKRAQWLEVHLRR